MELIITEDYASLSRAAADIVCNAVSAKPNAVVVLPTGSSPVGLFKELIARHRAGSFDPSRLRIFQMDDYYPVEPTNPNSLYAWLKSEFLDPLGIRPEQIVELPGNAADPVAACRHYDELLSQAGGYDLAVLGLGPNGHIGFNDPPATATAPTRVLDLSESSIATGSKSWGSREATPKQAISAGMQQLLGARQIVLIVSGEHKRQILKQSLQGPVTPDVPASYLQQTANVTVIADHAAWPKTTTN
ncbi:MAG: glucosamine-6-phosphate deaminase [Caldilineaceae bacterium]